MLSHLKSQLDSKYGKINSNKFLVYLISTIYCDFKLSGVGQIWSWTLICIQHWIICVHIHHNYMYVHVIQHLGS